MAPATALICWMQPQNMHNACLWTMIVMYTIQETAVQCEIWQTPNTCNCQQRFVATGHIMMTVAVSHRLAMQMTMVGRI